VGGKSPLTHGVKKVMSEERLGRRLPGSGSRLLAEEFPRGRNKVLTSRDQLTLPRFRSKRETGSETIQILRKQFGSQVGIICIGPAGR